MQLRKRYNSTVSEPLTGADTVACAQEERNVQTTSYDYRLHLNKDDALIAYSDHGNIRPDRTRFKSLF